MGGSWECIAEREGGAVAALAATRAAGGTEWVFAATAVGLYRSSDAGRSWGPASVGHVAPFVEAVAVSPTFPADRTVFAGTGIGLYRSRDGGERWQHVLGGGRVSAIGLSPEYGRDPVVLVGTEADGVLRSTDGGDSWAPANPGLLSSTVLALAMSPTFAEDQTCFAGTAAGLYRSRNAGRSWRSFELPVEDPAVQCVAVSPHFARDRLVWTGTEADGLWRSADGGQSWEAVSALAGRSVMGLACSNGGVAAATDDGVVLSPDGGERWESPRWEWGPVVSLAVVSAGAGEVLLAGTARRGVLRSADRGRTWHDASEGLHRNPIVALTMSPTFARDQTLFTAGLHDGVMMSTDGGRSWTERNSGLDEAMVFGVVAAPTGGSGWQLCAATSTGLFRSRDWGATWQRASAANEIAAPVVAMAVGAVPESRPAPWLVALRGGELLLADDGDAWRSLGWPFPGHDVLSVAVSPDFARTRAVWAGTTAGERTGDAEGVVLWCSTDGGKRWMRWLEGGEQPALPLTISPGYPADPTIFVGMGGCVLRPIRKAHELRSGARRPVWRRATLPEGPGTVTALATSPNYVDDATVFAATNRGVFVSRNAGDAFVPWNDGWDPMPVVALAVSPHYADDRLVYAVGLGGGIWRRRDG